MSRPEREGKPFRAEEQSLESGAAQVMSRLTAALVGVFDALPEPVSRAVDVARVLQINPQLAWQVFKLGHASDPLGAVQFLPTSNQLSRVLQAARKAGAAIKAIERAERASQQLDEFINIHAQSRADFESLVGSLAGGRAEQIDVKHRRALFRGHAHVCGIQARAAYVAAILHGNRPRVASMLMGYVGLHTLRRDVPMLLTTQAVAWDESQEQVAYRALRSPEMIPAFAVGAAQLLPAGEEDGRVGSRVSFHGVGRASAVSFCFYSDFDMGTVAPGSPLDEDVGLRLTIPIETVVLDLVLPSDCCDAARSAATTYFRRFRVDSVLDRRSVDVIPTRGDLERFSGVTDLPPNPAVPRLPEAVRAVLDARDIPRTSFDVFRFQGDYPVLHSFVNLRVSDQTRDREVPGRRV